MAKENEYSKVGGINFALYGISCMTYDTFVAAYKGNPTLTASLKDVWSTLKKECKAKGIKWHEDELKNAPKNFDPAVKNKKKKGV